VPVRLRVENTGRGSGVDNAAHVTANVDKFVDEKMATLGAKSTPQASAREAHHMAASHVDIVSSPRAMNARFLAASPHGARGHFSVARDGSDVSHGVGRVLSTRGVSIARDHLSRSAARRRSRVRMVRVRVGILVGAGSLSPMRGHLSLSKENNHE